MSGVLCTLAEWQSVSKVASQNINGENYPSCTTSASPCVGIRQDFPKNVLEAILILVAGTVLFH